MSHAAALVALLALPSPAAAAPDICGVIARIAAAASEPSPFGSLRQALADGEAVVPGFLAGDCRVGSGTLSCRVSDFVAGNFRDWPDPLACSGLVAVSPFPGRPGRDRQRAYLLAGIRIEYGVSCMGCAGGAHSYFSARVEGRPRAD